MKKVEYLFACLSEELSEVQQEISKCLRFTATHIPTEYYKTSNIQRVQLESADVYAISHMLFVECGIDTGLRVPENLPTDMEIRFNDKIRRTKLLMETSVALGVLNAGTD